MNLLRCEFCGKEIEHAHESAICTDCGHIMKKTSPMKKRNKEKVNGD